MHSEQADVQAQQKGKFVKSVDESTFNRIKQGGNAGGKEARGSSHSTIEHTGLAGNNPFASSTAFPMSN